MRADQHLTFIAAIMGPVVPLMLTMIPLEELLKKLLGILQASDEGRIPLWQGSCPSV